MIRQREMASYIELETQRNEARARLAILDKELAALNADFLDRVRCCEPVEHGDYDAFLQHQKVSTAVSVYKRLATEALGSERLAQIVAAEGTEMRLRLVVALVAVAERKAA